MSHLALKDDMSVQVFVIYQRSPKCGPKRNVPLVAVRLSVLFELTGDGQGRDQHFRQLGLMEGPSAILVK